MTKKRRTTTVKKKRLTFANVLIAMCLLVSFGITIAIVYEYHRLDTVIPSGVLTALFGLWGGELLIIAVRQIFGSDVIVKAKTAQSTDTGYDENGRV